MPTRLTAVAALLLMLGLSVQVRPVRADEQYEVLWKFVDDFMELKDEERVAFSRKFMLELKDPAIKVAALGMLFRPLRGFDGLNVVEYLPKELGSEMLPTYLTADDSRIRATAVELLAARSEAGPHSKAIRKVLQTADGAKLVKVVRAIGKIEDRSLLADLKPLLSHSEPEVRQNTCWSLLKRADNDWREAVIPLLSDPNDSAKVAALALLVKIGHADDLPLVHGLLKDPSDEVRRITASQLEPCRDESSGQALIASLADPSPEVRYTIAKSLGGRKGAAYREALTTLLGDSEHLVRQVTLRVVAEQEWSDVRQMLEARLQDEAFQVRAAAAEELGKLKDRAAISALALALGDPQWEVRDTTIRALVELDARSECPALLLLLNDGSYYVQCSAAQALVKLGDKSCLPTLRAHQRQYQNEGDVYPQDHTLIRYLVSHAIEQIEQR